MTKEIADRRQLELEWPVHKSGYVWADVDSPEAGARALRPAASSKTRYYKPLTDETGLFLTLANTSVGEDAIRRFANRYGLLVAFPNSGQSTTNLQTWATEIQKLKVSTTVWAWVVGRDAPQVEHHVYLSEGSVKFRFPSGDLEYRCFDVDGPMSEPLSRFFEARQHLRIGAFVVAAMIRREVESLNLTVYATGNAEDPSFRMYHGPPDLRTALWLQFGEAAAYEKVFGTCQTCSAAFELKPPQTRSNRKFCSDWCRTKAYRDRKKLRAG